MAKRKSKDPNKGGNVSPPEKSRSKKTSWFVNILLLAISLVIGLAILELGARWMLPKGPPPDRAENLFRVERTENEKMVFRLIPDTQFVTFGVPYRTNEYGFRDGPVEEKGEKTFRILCIGDSVTFGTGVKNEETFPNQLESMLGELVAEGWSVDVINAGISAFNTSNCLGLLQAHLEQFAPDIVVYTFVENDLDDSLSPGIDGYLVYYDPANPPDAAHIDREFPSTWYHSRIGQNENSSAFVQLLQNLFPEVPEDSLPLLMGDHPQPNQRWAEFERSLESMKELCQANAAHFSVYSFGARNMSEPNIEKVREQCEKLEIPHVSTLPLFEKGTYMDKYSLGFDPHCNPLGHEVMATRLLDQLTAEGWLREETFPKTPESTDYDETISDEVVERLSGPALESPHRIDLANGKGIRGLLGGFDPAARMARSCFFRLGPPGDRFEVELKGLVTAPGQQQTVTATIEGVTSEEAFDVTTDWKTYSFAIPEEFQDEVVEVELEILGPVWIPSPEQRRQRMYPYTAGVRWIERK
ncbi:MAG: hypothetical protein KC994_05285 [Candidatus Omnitrophica bacterium]|nr:hypothetical protein [Candidatus Omnitrophota bacterium]